MHIFPKCSKTLDQYEIPVLASELTATTLPRNVSLRLLLILRFKKKLNWWGGGGGSQLFAETSTLPKVKPRIFLSSFHLISRA